jgi:hypothetical protein
LTRFEFKRPFFLGNAAQSVQNMVSSGTKKCLVMYAVSFGLVCLIYCRRMVYRSNLAVSSGDRDRKLARQQLPTIAATTSVRPTIAMIMEIASIVMNANNSIMTATLAPATDVIGVQAMLPATIRLCIPLT